MITSRPEGKKHEEEGGVMNDETEGEGGYNDHEEGARTQ
jgi:hypothetical protein